MAKNPVISTEQIQTEIAELNEQIQTLQLATLGKDKEPCISYTPFLKTGSAYYIFISQLATHTHNLLAHPSLSILIIEDEDKSKNVFARKRLNLKCKAEELKQEDPEWNNILDGFEKRHGNTVKLLRSLPDFHLFRLTAVSGTYVKGFGQAFELTGDDIKHIKA
ncbi:hypothetical protein A3766_07545 [Oleiphilus sp. HI0132]|uniref:HugZ family pyridoxamine 5'-phosphate oxidase n=1 Tax=Oleiphilus sp. HI0132 TaxID=1822270 RepID=UPI0007C3DC28|nr:pyridoxamine 5'-phosphate oxidase family protein [Oleiphilus sp. HI0132]KZZ71999.1 hypothetical protein A3766_07545 [Oleiphilus sp. HI0132]